MTRKWDPEIDQYRDAGKFGGNNNADVAGGLNALDEQQATPPPPPSLATPSAGQYESVGGNEHNMPIPPMVVVESNSPEAVEARTTKSRIRQWALTINKDPLVRRALAQNPNATKRVIRQLSYDESPLVRAQITLHPKIENLQLRTFGMDPDHNVRIAWASNPRVRNNFRDSFICRHGFTPPANGRARETRESEAYFSGSVR